MIRSHHKSTDDMQRLYEKVEHLENYILQMSYILAEQQEQIEKLKRQNQHQDTAFAGWGNVMANRKGDKR